LKLGEKMIGSLYTFPRRLFWRRWQPTLSKLSQHFFFDLVRELSDTPHITWPKVCLRNQNYINMHTKKATK
jgi:hypothetical protein